jgi:hypothetical protein
LKEKLKPSTISIKTTKPALQKILKGLLHTEEEIRTRYEDTRKNKTI